MPKVEAPITGGKIDTNNLGDSARDSGMAAIGVALMFGILTAGYAAYRYVTGLAGVDSSEASVSFGGGR
jgi:hypothetical protein